MKRKVPVEISIKHVKCIELESGWALPPSPLIQQVTIWVRSTWCKKLFSIRQIWKKPHANSEKGESSQREILILDVIKIKMRLVLHDSHAM